MTEAFTHYSPKFRRDPNALVHHAYYGVAPNGQTVTRVVKPDADGNDLAATRTYEPGLERGQGGQIAHLIIGGMETTLSEIEDLIEAKKAKKWVPRKSNKEVADMCRELMNQRNEAIEAYQKNPTSTPPPPKRNPVLHLPVGVRWQNTPVPGLQIAARI